MNQKDIQDTLDMFHILADDPDQVAFKKKAPIWMLMASWSLPWWTRRFGSTQKIQALVLAEMLRLMRDQS